MKYVVHRDQIGEYRVLEDRWVEAIKERAVKENPRWNLTSYHARRAIGLHTAREKLWIETIVHGTPRTYHYEVLARRILVRNYFSPDFSKKKFTIERYKKIVLKIPTDSRGATLWLFARRKK